MTVKIGTLKVEIHNDKNEVDIVPLRTDEKTLYITKCKDHPEICYVHFFTRNYWSMTSFPASTEDMPVILPEKQTTENRTVSEALLLRLVAAAAHPDKVL